MIIRSPGGEPLHGKPAGAHRGGADVVGRSPASRRRTPARAAGPRCCPRISKSAEEPNLVSLDNPPASRRREFPLTPLEEFVEAFTFTRFEPAELRRRTREWGIGRAVSLVLILAEVLLGAPVPADLARAVAPRGIPDDVRKQAEKLEHRGQAMFDDQKDNLSSMVAPARLVPANLGSRHRQDDDG